MTPLLERLYNERVFSIFRLPDGSFEVREGCDEFFYVRLTADELRHLGQEIIELSADRVDD